MQMDSQVPERAMDFEERAALVLKWLFKTYRFVFTVFLGAGVVSFLAHHADMLIQFGAADWPPRRAQHIGWVVGFLSCLVAVPKGWVRAEIGKSYPTPSSSETPAKPEQPRERVKYSLRTALKIGLVGALVGALLGIILGGTMLLIWFSVALSPWGPASWADSLRWYLLSGLGTSHPAAGITFISAIGVSTVIGFLLGVTPGAEATWNGKRIGSQ
jgi:hypothetical protein